MKFKHVIGMDMAKETYVVHVHHSDYTQEFINAPKHICKMLKTLEGKLKCSLDQCLFCLEHTGLYSLDMIMILDSQSLNYSVIPGLEIKKSLGITRGKSDVIDAFKISEFGYLRQDKLTLHQMPSKALIKLKNLLSLRSMHVRHKASYQARMKEQFTVLKKTHFPDLYQSQRRMIDHLSKEIERIENAIKEIVNQDLTMKKCNDLLISIKGIGEIVAAHMIVKTQCFLNFNDWRKFSCYCGTAPFPNESGSMVKARRISKIGDSEMKTLLTLSARSAMMHDPEIKLFCKRKLDLGKSKKNITNCVRNKLIARMFAVVKRGTPYVTMKKFAS